MSEVIKMCDVREYAEGYEVTLRECEGRLVVQALNEAGHNCTQIDLLDLIAWVRVNRPELLA